ncbi:MAG: diguanylate cyclase [Roseateles depolymerans]|uniref:diguanylate cyclase n=1 Tax=Roseateles depolymerans TaxID=76731 RepID=A0A2W5DB73_9BURK|nr:MAG: diguanylate cyclase [Roseateles depolymerans]
MDEVFTVSTRRASAGWLLLVALLLAVSAYCATSVAQTDGDTAQVIHSATLTSLAGTQEAALPHVLTPADFSPQGSRVRYRLQFELTSLPAEPMGIYVPKMSLAGQVTLNGERIGACELGPLEQLRCLHRPYLFVPPASHWRSGRNTLEVEIYATGRQMNGLSAVTVGPAAQLSQGEYGQRRFVQVIVANGLAWAACCMGLIALSVSLALRGDRLYRWFGVTALAIALCNLNYTVTAPIVRPEVFSWLVFSANQLTAPLLMLTVLSFFRRDWPWARRALLAFMLIAPTAVWLSGSNRSVVAAMYAPFMLFGPLLAGASLRWAWRSRRGADLGMALSFAAVVACSFIDWFRLTGRSAFEGVYLVTYVIPSTIMVMGATLAGQLAKALHTARELAATLDQRVAERTEALQQANERLEALSTTDGLTGIANRRRFDDALASEWQRARRLRLPLTLVMVDVDHFKRFNDTYGHLAGDDCLRQLAQTLKRRMLRASDTTARYGGEEFALITGLDQTSALELAELIRQDVESQAVPIEGGPDAHITISAGVATVFPDEEHAPQVLIAQADEALYRAKNSGRNRVVVWTPAPGTSQTLAAQGEIGTTA